MKNLKDIIKQAIDIHVHIGPEVIPRKYTVQSLAKAEKSKIGGCVLKNHFYPTTPFIKVINPIKGMQLFGSVVLNNAVGGLNPDAVYSTSLVSDKPVMVWFPTTNAQNFLSRSEFEIAPEWVNKKGFKTRKSKDAQPVFVTKNGSLTKEALKVLETIKQCKAILATGHISWEESKLLIEEALDKGIKNIVVTHPVYQSIDMPVEIQKELAEKGCFIEQSYSMYSIDKIPIGKIAKQIKYVGSKSIILSSDVGQSFSPPPSEALLKFAVLLKREGISENEIYTMLVKNPRKLMSID